MVTLNRPLIKQHLRQRDYHRLFLEELGWDYVEGTQQLPVRDQSYTLERVAQKRGVVAYVCRASPLPTRPVRLAIDRGIAKSAVQHVVIFAPQGESRQVWQWASRQLNRPVRTSEHELDDRQDGEALIEKLATITFTLEEEGTLSHMDVVTQIQRIVDAGPVTRRFYDRFKKERDAFARFIAGIPKQEEASWYVSVMVNRLMFLYFIQKKGFLDGDHDYLAHKLAQSRERYPDRFYRDVLCPLFFESLSTPVAERAEATSELLGNVPYLNGGIFARHPVEDAHGADIQIPDQAFEALFTFFDQYHWHLDERPLHDDTEINPDVLGYIFEKYINQKELGAYYTKEDITGYIARNTLLPHLLDRTRRSCQIAFEGEQSVWRLLQDDPDRYIYPAVRHGCERTLPKEIEAGLHPPTLHQPVGEGPVATLEARRAWDRPTPPEFGLPTEIWRETVARRQRYEDLFIKLVDGEVRDPNDLITLNLDSAQFMLDLIENCEGPDLLRALWKALTEVTVLDPTCGSGAFLFAALNLLEPLYAACLDRMQAMVDELDAAGAPHSPKKLGDMRQTLTEAARHPNRAYYILKTIIVRNLYGVDIVPEAVEICRLRLFLKLVAQVEEVGQVEALPDIDFNIRAGNALVGFASDDEVKQALLLEHRGTLADGQRVSQAVMLGVRPEEQEALDRVTEQAQEVQRAYERFQEQQMRLGGAVTPADKQKLRERLGALEEELDRALARVYGVDPDSDQYPSWREAHQPLHWWAAFYGIMTDGGFDVIIGNPPYVAVTAKEAEALYAAYVTKSCGNLWAYCVERSLGLLRQKGRTAMIVQLSLTFSRDFAPIRRLLLEAGGLLRISSFDNIPDKLFTGDKQSENTSKQNQQRISIIVLDRERRESPAVEMSPLVRWRAIERPRLFAELPHTDMRALCTIKAFPKVGTPKMRTFLARWQAQPQTVSHLLRERGHYSLVVPKTAGYYIAAYEGELARTEQMQLFFQTPWERDLVAVLLNSNCFFWYWRVYGDAFHVTRGMVEECPLPEPLDEEYRAIAEGLRLAKDDCMVYKGYRGSRVPNVNYNLRMDLLIRADEWLIRHIAPGEGVTPMDFLWAKSNSFLHFQVPKAANWPAEYSVSSAGGDGEDAEEE